MSSSRITPTFLILTLWALSLSGCSSVNWLGLHEGANRKPIANPFASYRGRSSSDPAQTIVMRTRKGDRSVEIELPADAEKMSEFVIPVSPAFKDTNSRGLASIKGGGSDSVDESYKDHSPSASDREITSKFPQGLAETDTKRTDIEQGLNLAPSDEDNISEKSPSYLAGMDKIKQLYRMGRNEAALLETDEMIKLYQTDAKLHEMRGTLLDRLGRRELAMKSWNQALRFDASNDSLRKFLDRKQLKGTQR